METTRCAATQSPFLRLPPEIRLSIYELLLQPPSMTTTTTTTTTTTAKLPNFPPIPAHYTELDVLSLMTTTDGRTFRIRAEDPNSYALRRPVHRRSTFLIHGGPLRTQCKRTSYFLVAGCRQSIGTGFLRANAQIHAEAAALLYSRHTFDFGTHTEALIAFLGDLTPRARAFVRSVRMVKRALPYDKEFDRAEWATAMRALGCLPNLDSLSLGIVAGRPEAGYGIAVPYAVEDFEGFKKWEGMEWVGQLMDIKGLAGLNVEAVVEHCPLPRSEGMARFIRFSASVEGSFAEFLRREMLG